MSFLIRPDYEAQIKEDMLEVILRGKEHIRTSAELAALAEMQSYLRGRFDLSKIFVDVLPWLPGKQYQPGQAVYYQAPAAPAVPGQPAPAMVRGISQAPQPEPTLIYLASRQSIGDVPGQEPQDTEPEQLLNDPTFQSGFEQDYWQTDGDWQIAEGRAFVSQSSGSLTQLVQLQGGAQYEIVIRCESLADGGAGFTLARNNGAGLYYMKLAVGDNKQTITAATTEELAFKIQANSGGCAVSLCYFTKLSVAAPEPAWQLSDPRPPLLVTYLIDLTLYLLHSGQNPRGIPALRQDRYEAAIEWLKMCRSGKISPGLPYAPDELPDGSADPELLKVRFNSHKKLRNAY